MIENVDVSRPTPVWMVERLRRSGVRSIDAIVDITNYVMLELGQPMHAFDRDQLVGAIDVRMANDGEQLVLLDGKTLTLTNDVLVIADQEKPLALAGIMGGEHSGIADKTTSVFLESAYFNPITVAGKARRYGLHTDASARFERGVDWQLAEQACQRATALLIDVCGGTPGPVMITDNEQALPDTQVVELSNARIEQQLKINLSTETIQQMLEALGFGVEVRDGGFRCVAPSWRFDVSIEQDLIEEIARIYGYNNLPTSLPAQALTMASVPRDRHTTHAFKELSGGSRHSRSDHLLFVDLRCKRFLVMVLKASASLIRSHRTLPKCVVHCFQDLLRPFATTSTAKHLAYGCSKQDSASYRKAINSTNLNALVLRSMDRAIHCISAVTVRSTFLISKGWLMDSV